MLRSRSWEFLFSQDAYNQSVFMVKKRMTHSRYTHVIFFSNPHISVWIMSVFWHIPVLSAQLMTAPTGRPSEIRNFAPDEPPRPETQENSDQAGNGDWNSLEQKQGPWSRMEVTFLATKSNRETGLVWTLYWTMWSYWLVWPSSSNICIH